MARSSGFGTAHALTVATMATIVCVLPNYLTGALATQMMDELVFTATGLGIAVGAFRVGGAISSWYLGGLADRLGATRSLRLGVLAAAIPALAIGTTVNRWGTLVVTLFVAGVGQVLAQPAANRLLVNRIRPERQGAAFGIKQSAPPAATMLAGVSVPAVALTIGWRWAFILASILSLVVIAMIGRRPASSPATQAARKPDGERPPRRTIIILLMGFGFGTMASNSVAPFYVVAAVRSGTASDVAGILLSVASLAAILTRLAAGVLSDRLFSGHLRICAGLLAFGAIGLVLLSSGEQLWMAIGLVIALSGTWGFNGVFWYALVKHYPKSPGAVTGVVSPGGLTGGVIGPIGFGFIAEGLGYQYAWIMTSVVAVAAATMMVLGSRRLAADRAEQLDP